MLFHLSFEDKPLYDVSMKLKDGKTVLIREFKIEDKEKLIDMYASLSGDAVRWACLLIQERLLKDG